MYNNGRQCKTTRHIALALTLIILLQTTNVAQAEHSTLTGTITDQQGTPVNGAEIKVLSRQYIRHWTSSWSSYTTTTTDADGKYSLSLETDGNYLILVTHTSGDDYDYIPYSLYHNPSETAYTEDITLWEAAIIKFDGLAYFIETTAIPDNTFRLIGIDSTEIIRYGDLGLSYSQNTGSISSYLNIQSNKVYAPVGLNFNIEVQSYASYNGETIQKSLTITKYASDTLSAGEEAEIDLRSLILDDSIMMLLEEVDGVEEIIVDKEKQGFFLAVERQYITEIQQTIETAQSKLEQGNYEEAFTETREAFIQLTDLESSINSLLTDANNSVYVLLAFISATSVVVASLIFEDKVRKTIASTGFYAVMLIIFYYLHPGAQIAERTGLIKASIISIVAVNIAALILPTLMNKGSTGKDVSLLNMTTPILSIAKRSLRRRKLRFMLTLISVLLLVASFISLTSFTSGYGLSFTKTKDSVGKEGVMIMTPDPPPTQAAAPFSGGTGVSSPLSLDESLLDWYGLIEEVAEVVPRYENYAQRQYRESNTPIATIGRTPIFGIACISPEFEATVNKLDTALVDGRYLSDSPSEVLISTGLSEKLGKAVGDVFTLYSKEQYFNLTIVGILDDDSLEELTGIDGESIMPQKIIEWDRIEADGPDFVTEALAPCTADETIWVNYATGKTMTALWLMKLNLVLDEDISILEFARSTALNRGFRAWASTNSGIYLAQLTGYFEGKGLPIVIPWVIVVLNVIVTMMNAYYERRHEVMIYSSIGMNPRHISAIFLAEAAVIGIVGGCLGYLVGLGAYKIIYLLTPALQVKQKVSAFWSLAAIGISMMAVLVGGLSALKNSTSITPSLQRRWTIDQNQESKEETRIVLPVQVYEEELQEYVDFIWAKLERAKRGNDMAVRLPKMNQTGEKSWEYTFIYSSANTQISPLYSRNRLVVEKGAGKTYTTVLYTKGDDESVKHVGGFMRQLGLDWSLQREEGEH